MKSEKPSQSTAVSSSLESEHSAQNNQLMDYREAITKIDIQILSLLKKRQVVAAKIGQIKKLQDWPVRDPNRELTHTRALIQANQDLDPEMIQRLMQLLFDTSVSLQDSLV